MDISASCPKTILNICHRLVISGEDHLQTAILTPLVLLLRPSVIVVVDVVNVVVVVSS